MADANKLLTVRQIADALGVPKSKVMYMLRTEGITPTARASQTLLFLPSVVSVLQRALEKQIPQPRGEEGVTDDTTQYVVVFGVQMFGPFDSEDHAKKWMAQSDIAKHPKAFIIPLTKPEMDESSEIGYALT